MKARFVMVIALVVLSAGSVAACRAKSDNNSESSASDVTTAMGTRDRTTGTRHEIGCASRRRCF